MTQLNRYVEEVTQRIIDRSADLRADYLAQIAEDHNNRPVTRVIKVALE